MMINYVKIEKDETAYSWLKRAAAANAMGVNDFVNLILKKKNYRKDAMDCLKKICSLYEIDLFETVWVLVLKGVYPLYSEEIVSSLVGIVENMRFVPGTTVQESKRYLCPECMKEDIENTKGAIHAPDGYYWYHKAHHMPGVRACHKHKCALLEFSGKENQEDDLNYYQKKEISEEDIAYSKFVYDFMNLDVTCKRDDIMEAVYAKLKEDGYYKSHINKEAFEKAFPDFSSHISTYSIEKLLKFLSLVFGDAETFRDYLIESECTDEFTLPPEFTCINRKGHVLEVEHSCGNRFLTTKYLLRAGYGCPECDKKFSEQDFLIKVFKMFENGEYEPQEKLMFSEKGLFRHSCGKTFYKSPKHILFGKGICQCNEIKTFEDAKRFIDKTPDFEIVDFERAKKPITLRHKTCGNTFDIYIHDFIQRPFCRVCESNRLTENDVQNMLGEEYDLIDFKSSFVPMTIRHKKCGKSFQIKYWRFKARPGCRECESRFVDSEKMSFLVSELGDYELTGFTSVNDPIRIKHLGCGREFEADYYVFKDNPHCYLCDPTIKTFAMAKEEIEALGDFELVKYGGISAPATIRHKTCGREFTIYYNKFLERPWCKCCNPQKMTTEKLSARIKEETNGEYELVGDFVDQDTKINVLHKKCGRITPYGPKYWHEGARCPYCTGIYTDAWYKMFLLLCDYNAEFGNTDIPKRNQYKGQQLGLWCNKQRAFYKENRLRKDREERLRSIGFVFDPLEEEWNRRLEQYRRYVEESGSAYISRRTDFEGEHLGAWVETQRKWYNAGKLSKEREEKLLEINPTLFTADNVKEGLKHHPVYKSNK